MLFLFFLFMTMTSAHWQKDPKHCEVCVKVLTDIHASVKILPDKKNLPNIESLITKYCSKKNKKAGPRERKLCYYIEPIKRMISTPLSFGADAIAICKKLERTSAEVCTVKYPIKTDSPQDYKKMRVKYLKQILRERGVSCRGCVDKRQFVKKCQDTEHLDM